VVVLASEFETNAARTVLPCLDEPQYKVCVLTAAAARVFGCWRLCCGVQKEAAHSVWCAQPLSLDLCWCCSLLLHTHAHAHHPLQATFAVEVDAPAHLTVLSNSPVAASRWTLEGADSSVARVTFQPTPPMSTYLLSFAVGDLKAVTAHTSRHVGRASSSTS
jgi:hypothetical protein